MPEKNISFKQVSISVLTGIIVAGLFSFGIYVFASPPASPYAPGETLNPSCAPGDPNCTVTAAVPYTGATTNVDLGSNNFTTTATVTAGIIKVGSAFTLPTTDGTSGQFLQTDGAGNLTWVTGSGGVSWGSITGTLSAQTDLQNALNAKVPTSTTVNGHALSGNISVTASDVGLGNVTNNAQVTSVSGTAPIISSGGTTPAISITQAGSSGNGYLSSSDWNTFNNKQSALTFSTGLTNTSGTVTVNTSQNITTLSNLTGNGFVKTNGGGGALSIDTNTYLTT